MSQPWPHAQHASAIWSYALLALGLTLALFVGMAITGGKLVHQQTVPILPTAVSGSPEAATFAGPIFVTETGNLQVRVTSPVSNSWLYLDGALINDETAEVDDLDLEVAYYFGSDSDGSWSEGNTQAVTYVASVPPGRYMLRLAPQWEAGKAPPASYQLTVKSRVPRFWHALLAALALLAWPLGLAWSKMRFESRRWSESDHPWSSSGDSSSGDDE
jgi:hypothetical protein